MTDTNLTYRPVTPKIITELETIVGEKQVLSGDPDRMIDYSHDEIPGTDHAHMPEVVVKPISAEQIAAIMKLANRERIPVTPRGAGSGLSGGAVPIFGGIVLSLERMNRILEIDSGNMMVVVEPGVITNEINQAVRELGLFYAGYPMSEETCSIGGNVAENAGSGRAIKYGVTERYVQGLEVVLPTGEIIHLGGKRVKDVTGYDLKHLLVGSEGTLGIFTQITLRLLPLPTARIALLIPFPDVRSVIASVPQIVTQCRVLPSSIEFMDRLSIDTAYNHINETPPNADTGAMLLIELDGNDMEQVEEQAEGVVDICLQAGALDVFVGNTPASEKRMWRPRLILSEALKMMSSVQSVEDIVVPLASIPDLVPLVEELSRKYDVIIPCFGHAADGNIHVSIIKRPETPREKWDAEISPLLHELYHIVIGLGGTISGEHGVGSKRAPYLSVALEPTVIDLQKRIKALFDPLNVLNPGKIFPA